MAVQYGTSTNYADVLANLKKNKNNMNSAQYERLYNYASFKQGTAGVEDLLPSYQLMENSLLSRDNSAAAKRFRSYIGDKFNTEYDTLSTTWSTLAKSRAKASTIAKYGIALNYSDSYEDQVAKVAGYAPASFDINQYLPNDGKTYDTTSDAGVDLILSGYYKQQYANASSREYRYRTGQITAQDFYETLTPEQQKQWDQSPDVIKQTLLGQANEQLQRAFAQTTGLHRTSDNAIGAGVYLAEQGFTAENQYDAYTGTGTYNGTGDRSKELEKNNEDLNKSAIDYLDELGSKGFGDTPNGRSYTYDYMHEIQELMPLVEQYYGISNGYIPADSELGQMLATKKGFTANENGYWYSVEAQEKIIEYLAEKLGDVYGVHTGTTMSLAVPVEDIVTMDRFVKDPSEKKTTAADDAFFEALRKMRFEKMLAKNEELQKAAEGQTPFENISQSWTESFFQPIASTLGGISNAVGLGDGTDYGGEIDQSIQELKQTLPYIEGYKPWMSTVQNVGESAAKLAGSAVVGMGISSALGALSSMAGTAITYDSAMLANPTLQNTGMLAKLAPNDLLKGMLVTQFGDSYRKYQGTTDESTAVVASVIEAVGMTYIEGLGGIGAASGENIAAGIASTKGSVLKKIFAGLTGYAGQAVEELGEEAAQSFLQGSMETVITGQDSGNLEQFSIENAGNTAISIAATTLLFYLIGLPAEISNNQYQTRAQAILDNIANAYSTNDAAALQRYGLEASALANEAAANLPVDDARNLNTLNERTRSFMSQYLAPTQQEQLGQARENFNARFLENRPVVNQQNIDAFYNNFLGDQQPAQAQQNISSINQPQYTAPTQNAPQTSAQSATSATLLDEIAPISAQPNAQTEAQPRTAEVLTTNKQSKPTLGEQIKKSYDFFKRRFTDTGANIANAAKNVKDDVMYPLYNEAKQARIEAQYMIGVNQYDIRGNDVGDGLIDIMEPINKKGDAYKKDFFTYLLHKHNANGRYQEGKPVFGENVTDQDSAMAVEIYEAQHPEFVEQANKIYKYLQNLMKWRVESGLVSQQQADEWNALYPYYVPTYRKSPSTKGSKAGGNSVRVNQTVNAAKGSDLDILPIDEQIARMTLAVVQASKINVAANKFLQLATDNPGGMAGYIDEISIGQSDYDIDNDAGEDLKNVVKAYRNGEAVSMRVNYGVYDGFENLSATQKEYDLLVDGSKSFATIFKKLITGYNPVFTAKNFLKDLQDAGINTKYAKRFLKNYGKALKEIATNGEMWKLYQKFGGTGSSFFDYNKGIHKPNKLYQYTVGAIESINMAIEQAPRLSEFISTIEAGGRSYENIVKATLNAADVTVNFGRSGSWGKVLNSTFVPFFNPAIQGTSKFIRLFTESKGAKEWTSLVLRAVAMGIAPALLNNLLYDDDDEWKIINQRDKDRYYLFKLGNGKWIKIPKGRIASMFGGLANRGYNLATGQDMDWAGYIELAKEQIAPQSPFESNLLTPLFDAKLFNEKDPGTTWYGTDIETRRMQNYKPSERYDASTDEFSKWLGSWTGWSPAKINYLLDAYTGAIGDFLLPALTPQAESTPFERAFVLDTLRSNNISSRFYNMMDDITYRRNDGDEQAAKEYTIMNRYVSDISEINQLIREVQSSDLSDAEKTSKVRYLTAMINQLQLEAIDAIDNYSEPVPWQGVDPEVAGVLKSLYAETEDNIFLLDDDTFTYHETEYDYPTDLEQNVSEGYTVQHGENAGEEIDGINDVINSTWFQNEDADAQEQIIRDTINAIMNAVEYDTVYEENPLALAETTTQPDTSTYYGFNEYWQAYDPNDEVITALDGWQVYPHRNTSFSSDGVQYEFTADQQEALADTTYTALRKYFTRLDAASADKIIERVYAAFKEYISNGRTLDTDEILDSVYTYMDEKYEWS